MSEENNSQPQINFFNLRDHIRLRPGMYFGSVDRWALHHILFEVLDDAIEEANFGHCDHIWLTLHPNDTVTVRDNGRGIPLGIVKDGKRLLEHVMIERAHRVQGDYELLHGLHGIGALCPMNALSAECAVEVARDGYVWRQTYREGIAQTELMQVRALDESEATGTSITFRPDFTILEPNTFNYETVAERMRELAYLLPGLTLTLRDEREAPAKQEKFFFLNGLSDYLYDLNQAHAAIHAPRYEYCEWTIRANGSKAYTISVDVALQYTDTMETKVIGYVNTLRTYSGLHIDILPFVIAEAINPFRRIFAVDEPFSAAEVLPGLTAIIVVKHPEPIYTSTRNLRLLSSDAAGITAKAVSEAVHAYFSTDELERMVEKCLANRRAIAIKKRPTGRFAHLQDKRLRLKHRRGNRL
jgi:DNA gyrase subunit B